MLTNFASSLRVISKTPWMSLTRQELLDLIPLTNDHRVDFNDPKAEPWLSRITTGSHFRDLIHESLTDQLSWIHDTASVVRMVDDNSTIYAWGAVWGRLENTPEKDVGLYVRHDVRRQGLGTIIINELRAGDRPGERVSIRPRPWNDAGRKFFASIR